jgi:hypothetical protein
MKKIVFILVFSFGFTLIKSQTKFQKRVGTIYDDVGLCIEQTSDGGYITLSAITGDSTFIYVVKSNVNGNSIWSKKISTWINNAFSIHQCKDGGFAITGYYRGTNTSRYDVSLIKLNNNGNLVWSKYFKDNLPPSFNVNVDQGNSIIELADSSLIIAGSTSSYGAGNSDILLIKTDKNGNIIWNKTYGLSGEDEAHSIFQLPNNGFVVCGTCAKNGAGDNDSFLMKIDSLGNIVWSKSYGTTNGEYGYFAQQTKDKGFIITGTGQSITGGWDAFLIKTDSIGNLSWTKKFGDLNDPTLDDNGWCVKQLSDGNYAFTGGTGSLGASISDVFLIKVDTIGNIIWNKSYRINNQNFGRFFQQTLDGGFALTGGARSGAFAAPSDIFFIKTDGFGNSGCNESDSVIATSIYLPTVTNLTFSTSIPIYSIHNSLLLVTDMGTVTSLCTNVGINELNSNKDNLVVFPNPSKAQFNFKNVQIGNDIEIFDGYGKIVYKGVSKNYDEEIVDFKGKENGIYFYKISSKSITLRQGKLILNR